MVFRALGIALPFAVGPHLLRGVYQYNRWLYTEWGATRPAATGRPPAHGRVNGPRNSLTLVAAPVL